MGSWLMLRVTLCFPDINLSAVQRISFTTLLRDRQSHSGGIGGGEKERLIWSKRKTRRKENWKRDRAWPASKLAPDEILFCHLSRVYFQWVYVNRTQRIRIRTWPYVIRWVMYSHKSMFLIAFGCIAREVTEHRVYVCSLSFDILCGRCTTAS